MALSNGDFPLKSQIRNRHVFVNFEEGNNVSVDDDDDIEDYEHIYNADYVIMP